MCSFWKFIFFLFYYVLSERLSFSLVNPFHVRVQCPCLSSKRLVCFVTRDFFWCSSALLMFFIYIWCSSALLIFFISSDAPRPFWFSSFLLMLLSPSDFLHFFWCSSALLIFFIGANPFLFFVSPFRVPFTGNLRSIPCHKNPIHVLKSSPLTAFSVR